MGKSSKSKLAKKWRTVKRKILSKPGGQIDTQTNNVHEKLKSIANGTQSRDKKEKNKFLHPNDPDACIPQWDKPTFIDTRAHKNTEFLDGMTIGFRKKRNKTGRTINITEEYNKKQGMEDWEDDKDE